MVVWVQNVLPAFRFMLDLVYFCHEILSHLHQSHVLISLFDMILFNYLPVIAPVCSYHLLGSALVMLLFPLF